MQNDVCLHVEVVFCRSLDLRGSFVNFAAELTCDACRILALDEFIFDKTSITYIDKLGIDGFSSPMKSLHKSSRSCEQRVSVRHRRNEPQKN